MAKGHNLAPQANVTELMLVADTHLSKSDNRALVSELSESEASQEHVHWCDVCDA